MQIGEACSALCKVVNLTTAPLAHCLVTVVEGLYYKHRIMPPAQQEGVPPADLHFESLLSIIHL
jgi:hypothetical protein